MSERVIPVYTTLGRTKQERNVAFPIPPEMDQLKLIDMGFAIDGRDAAFTVAPRGDGGFTSVFGGEWSTLSRALWATQRGIATYFRAQGFNADFK